MTDSVGYEFGSRAYVLYPKRFFSSKRYPKYDSNWGEARHEGGLFIVVADVVVVVDLKEILNLNCEQAFHLA